MKKFVLLSFLLAALSQLSMAQSIGDDLYFVPKKEKKEKTVPVERAAEKKTVTVITSDGQIRQVPASEAGIATVSSKQLQAASATVRDASGVERDVDEYNRRYTSSSVDAETVYVEEEETEEEGEWLRGFEGSQEDYEYATRLIRFRSPRVAVPVSSPLYWDIVYTWSPLDWNVYIDGSYAYAFPTLYNPSWWSWHYDPWYWNYGWNWHISYGGWGLGWGWNDPWYHPYHYPYWGHHHHHHGPIWAGGGGHLGGSWRDGFYYDNRRRAADRPNAVRGDRREDNTVRATRGNDRGTVASRENTSIRADRTSGRVVAGRNTDDAVRSTTSGRNTSVKDAVPAEGRTSRNTVSRSNSSSPTDRSTGNYTRSSSNRSSTGRATNSSVRNSSSRSSSSGNVSRSNSNSTRSSSSDNVSRSSSSRSSGSFSSGSSSSSRSSSMGGGSSRSSGGGGGRSGGGRR